ncbi:hypothetical protein WNE24_28940 [Bacillus thuringiensis]|uniref:hypothetical protein n=1 Tax=Bacillus thuringiensis TaxID=1428 RepID=UPI00310141E9
MKSIKKRLKVVEYEIDKIRREALFLHAEFSNEKNVGGLYRELANRISVYSGAASLRMDTKWQRINVRISIYRKVLKNIVFEIGRAIQETTKWVGCNIPIECLRLTHYLRMPSGIIAMLNGIERDYKELKRQKNTY